MRCDNLGVWIQTGKRSIPMNYKDGNNEVIETNMVIRNWRNKSFELLKRIEYSINTEPFKNRILMVYNTNNHDISGLTILPHGNSKSNEPYQRTVKTTLDNIEKTLIQSIDKNEKNAAFSLFQR